MTKIEPILSRANTIFLEVCAAVEAGNRARQIELNQMMREAEIDELRSSLETDVQQFAAKVEEFYHRQSGAIK